MMRLILTALILGSVAATPTLAAETARRTSCLEDAKRSMAAKIAALPSAMDRAIAAANQISPEELCADVDEMIRIDRAARPDRYPSEK
jgi:hypothetical protein